MRASLRLKRCLVSFSMCEHTAEVMIRPLFHLRERTPDALDAVPSRGEIVEERCHYEALTLRMVRT